MVASEASGPLALVSCAAVIRPGVGLDREVGLEPVLAAVTVLWACRASGSMHRDHPVRGDPLGDPPPPVGAVRSVDRFDVLAGDQRQQRHRLGRLRAEFLLGQVPEQPVRVADQRVDQLGAGLLVVPGDPGLPGSS